MGEHKDIKILYVAAEAEPFVKAGRLGEIANHLPKSLFKLGNDIRVVIPKYKSIRTDMEYVTDFPVKTAYRKETCVVRKVESEVSIYKNHPKITVYFIDNHHYFDRDKLYGYFDDGERAAFFSMATLKMLSNIMFKPDIIHCNEWHTGPLSMILKEFYKGQFFYKDIKTVFSIQKLKHQGFFDKSILEFMCINEGVFRPEKAEYYGKVNFLKIGIVYSDYVVFNSKTYAKAVLEKEYGEGLNEVLKAKEENIYSIINGISYEENNPEFDKELRCNFNINCIDEKIENKHELQEEIGLPRVDVPLIAIISKLNKKKGFDLIFDNLNEFMKLDMQLVAIGEGLSYYEDKFKKIQDDYFNRVSVFIENNPELSKRILAGSDMILIPSLVESCGLNQIMGLRYGTIPISRSTGALAETVVDVREDFERGNGFIFEEYTGEAFLENVKFACEIFEENQDMWMHMMENAMKSDYSWDFSARRYQKLYKEIIQKNKNTNIQYI